jgi:DnaJ-class molecular chaperone
MAVKSIRCAFCKGEGVYLHTQITCTVCRGKGLVAVEGPIEECPKCRGRGAEANSGLPCLGCGGKGVLAGHEIKKGKKRIP